MKLIIQIPCLNEELTLPDTLADLPKSIDGVDVIETLVVDDGSRDRTVEIAKELGVNHVISHKTNQGLGKAFRTGMDASLRLGADIIVNTDGDNQYYGGDIPKLIGPILNHEADIVIGDRQVANNTEFSFYKKCMQWLGSRMVRSLSNTKVSDAVSGFRAISRGAALRLNILSTFSYSVEMVIQAGNKQMTIVTLPIRTNAKTRESRLFKSIPHFVANQLVTMIRMYAMYRPLRFFLYLGSLISLVGMAPVLRFLFSYFSGDGEGNIQSLILGGALLTMGFMIFVTGLLADLISHNRRLNEVALEKVREMQLDQMDADSSLPDARYVRGKNQ
ncbi:MAG: glycosyltransferase family 2 protein [Halioglobus sp.]|nr:glycosyltransferase family 2 protein [Halioglobus sp.]